MMHRAPESPASFRAIAHRSAHNTSDRWHPVCAAQTDTAPEPLRRSTRSADAAAPYAGGCDGPLVGCLCQLCRAWRWITHSITPHHPLSLTIPTVHRPSAHICPMTAGHRRHAHELSTEVEANWSVVPVTVHKPSAHICPMTDDRQRHAHKLTTAVDANGSVMPATAGASRRQAARPASGLGVAPRADAEDGREGYEIPRGGDHRAADDQRDERGAGAAAGGGPVPPRSLRQDTHDHMCLCMFPRDAK